MKKIIASALCALLLCSCSQNIGIIGGADGPTSIFTSDGTEKKLYESKTAFVGDNSAVGALLGNISQFVGRDGFELYTDAAPYGVGVYTYNTAVSDSQTDSFRRGAAILMCLVENCDYVRLVNRTSGTVFCESTRADWDRELGTSLAEYSSSYEKFCELFRRLSVSGYDDSVERDDRISRIILEQNRGRYLEGECVGEGHVLLGTEQVDSTDIYYLVTTYGEYGFENGRFVKVAGTGAIPTRITIDRANNAVEYRQPLDGGLYMSSLEEIFPKEYIEAATDKNGELYARCEVDEQQYAYEYLEKINRRDAGIGYDNGRDYLLDDMNTDASNKLLDLYYEYPYWIGTLEKIEDGVRYVYKKSWTGEGGGDGVVTYEKYRFDNNQIAERAVIKVTGGELECLEGTLRTNGAK